VIAAPDAVAARLRAIAAGGVASTAPSHGSQHVSTVAPAVTLRCPAGAPVPGWVPLVAIADAAARAAEPPCTCTAEARDGRLTWREVRGSPAFLDLLWLLEELSASLCEVCGGPGCTRERWGGWVRTLCPRHAVDVAAAGPRFAAVYVRGWETLAPRYESQDTGATLPEREQSDSRERR
jgi:hypothetical protein